MSNKSKAVPMVDLNFQVRPQAPGGAWGSRKIDPEKEWSAAVRTSTGQGSAPTVFAPPPQSSKNTHWGARLARPLMSSQPKSSTSGVSPPGKQSKSQSMSDEPDMKSGVVPDPSENPTSITTGSTTRVSETATRPPVEQRTSEQVVIKPQPKIIKTAEEKFQQLQRDDIERLGAEVLGYDEPKVVEQPPPMKASKNKGASKGEKSGRESTNHEKKGSNILITSQNDSRPDPENTGTLVPPPAPLETSSAADPSWQTPSEEPEAVTPGGRRRRDREAANKVEEDRRTEIQRLMFGRLNSDGEVGEIPYEKQPFIKPQLREVEQEPQLVVQAPRRGKAAGWKPKLPSLSTTITNVRKEVHESFETKTEFIQVPGREKYLADPEAYFDKKDKNKNKSQQEDQQNKDNSEKKKSGNKKSTSSDSPGNPKNKSKGNSSAKDSPNGRESK